MNLLQILMSKNTSSYGDLRRHYTIRPHFCQDPTENFPDPDTKIHIRTPNISPTPHIRFHNTSET